MDGTRGALLGVYYRCHQYCGCADFSVRVFCLPRRPL